MISPASGINPEPSLLYSYTAYRKEVPVILELWGSQERINKGVVKDLSGKQLSIISETSILGGEDLSITGPALLVYLKATKLLAVLYIQGKEEIAWLFPTLAWLEEKEVTSQNFLGGDFCEIIRQNCRTKEDLDLFAEKAFENGTLFFQKSNFAEASVWFARALFVYLLLKNKRNAGACYGSLGVAFRSLGDYRQAIECHEKDLQIAKEVGNKAGEGATYGNLSVVYDSLGDYHQAIEYHEKSLQIAKETGITAREGGAYGNLGDAFESLGEYRKAIEYHEKHLQIVKEIGDKAGEGRSYSGLGNAYNSLGEYRKAVESYEKHLQIAKEIGDKAGEGRSYGNLGNAYNSLGEYRKTIEYQKAGLQIAKEIGDKAGEGDGNHNLGHSFFMFLEYPNSEDAFIQAIAIYSDIQASLGHDAWKISIFEEQSKTYHALERNYFITGKEGKALEICEKGRARALFDLYSERLGLSKEGCEQRANINLEKMQEIAKREKASFIYFSRSFDNDLHAWVVKEDGIQSKKIVLSKGFQSKAPTPLEEKESRRSLMGDYLPVRTITLEGLSDQTLEKEESLDRSAHLSGGLEELYKALISPIEGMLDGEKLIIITDATMRDVPFAALYRNGPNGNGREYLIDKYTISMTPSLRIFDLLHEKKPLKNGSALIVADPAVEEKRLPGAKREGRILAREMASSKFLSEDGATAEAIKQTASDASILHFACHGSADARFDKDSVFEGGLCLTNGNGEMEMLHADEIQKFNLKADLVVLSACQTGKGAQRHEGVIGISRAFLGAGVPSVVATHWSIQDEVTVDLMRDFYHNLLNREMTKAEALREAMLTQRKKHPEQPSLWGAFFLVGK